MSELAINIAPTMAGFIGKIMSTILNILGGILLFIGFYYMAKATYQMILRR